MYTRVKTPKEIAAMRLAGKMLATVLNKVKNEAKAGMSTKDLADIAAKEIRSLGGEASFLGYHGFPDVLCVSINDEVVHGIPREDHIIENGDIIGIDFGVTHQGMITDAALTFALGEVAEPVLKMIQATEQALYAGIDALKAGVRVGDVSSAIQKVLEKQQLSIVRALVGHGVGHELHEDPNIPNYGFAGSGPILKEGMTIAIEPMTTLGTHEVKIDPDGWTIRTKDGSLSAHFEHTVLVTDKGYEILTQL
jgi:methionyl aminopeptidase